jgi:repressor LexA
MMNSAVPPNRNGPGQVLTWRQHRIVEFIERYARDHGCSPSNRDIADGAGLASVSSVSHQLRTLKAMGVVSYDPGSRRTVRVLRPGNGEAGENVVWVPIVGRIAAGDPITAEQSIERHLPLPKEVVGGQEGLFILEVVGESMTGAGILPGDWVVLRQLSQPPQNGDIVAATIDDVEVEGTVKTYKKAGGQVWLMPQNSAYTPIPGGKAKFAGKVIAVLRRI